MIRNLVFDWSGTLSDDFEAVYHTVKAVFHGVGVAPLSFSHFQEVIDIPHESYIRKLFRDDPESLGRFSDEKVVNGIFNDNFRAPWVSEAFSRSGESPSGAAGPWLPDGCFQQS